ncbi:MAG: NYN domain-containing protein [Candidatus Saccharimonadales bacterium]
MSLMFNPRKRGRRPNAYAFIDSQNLNLGTQKAGWKMDWRRFRQYLREKYNVTHAYMFIGYVPEFEQMYKQLHESGYLIVLKPTSDLSKPAAEEGADSKDKPEDKKPIKGNIDADLVLWAMKEINNYDKAIIVSGDGDFHGLLEYLQQQNKLLHVMTPNWQYSQLLKEFDKYLIRLDQLKGQLQYKNHSKYKNKKPS